MARVSLRISKGFAKATEPRRLGRGPKSVSEALLSLFDRTSPKLVRLKKPHIFNILRFRPACRVRDGSLACREEMSINPK
jgi:hypothetical protein